MDSPLLIGVIASIIAIVIVGIFKWLGYGLIFGFEKVSKHEPDIAGKWVTEYEEGGKTFSENATIIQRGSRISGEIRLRELNDGQVYHFKGTFKHRILSAEYWSPDEIDYERGTFVLQLIARELRGQHILFDSDDELITSRYVWKQKK